MNEPTPSMLPDPGLQHARVVNPPPLRGPENPRDVRAIAAMGIFILFLFYTLYFARLILIPIVLALYLSLVLAPVIRGLKQIHVPQSLGAGLVMIVLLSTIALGIYSLADPTVSWTNKLPQSIRTVEGRIRDLRKPVENVTRAAQQVEKLATVDAKPEVSVKEVSWSDNLFSRAQGFITGAVITFFLLWFLLEAQGLFIGKMVGMLAHHDRQRVVDIVRDIEEHISRYLLSITLINIGLGMAVAAAMGLLGMPNPVLWGVMTALLNYIPYIGAFSGGVVVTLVALLTFDTVGRALLVPLAYFALQMLESNVVTPRVVGRQMQINAVVLFVGVILWGWLWGIAGALLAVPILVTLKIVCDHVESLAPLGAFLGD
jgi:predicted PurR-regulated permease PerM